MEEMSVEDKPNSTTANIVIRVREETYENQRWSALKLGFCHKLLPTDRYPFSNRYGTENRDKKMVEVLPSNSWKWLDDWQIERTFDGQDLEDGWMYALDFPRAYSAKKTLQGFVRRRKWYRTREFNYPQNSMTCAWAIAVSNQIYFRQLASHDFPGIPSEWSLVNSSEPVFEAAQITVSANGLPIVVTRAGHLLFRHGITPSNLTGTDWITVNSPPGGMHQISVGQDTLCIVTRDWKCWILKQKLKSVLVEIENKVSPVQCCVVDWIEIQGPRIKAISVSKNDLIILAIPNEEMDNVILYRTEVTPDNSIGQDWGSVTTCHSISQITLPFDSQHHPVNNRPTSSKSTGCLKCLQLHFPKAICTAHSVDIGEDHPLEVEVIELKLNESNEASPSDLTDSSTILKNYKNANSPKVQNTRIVSEFVCGGKGTDIRLYHPLLNGFLPGSELLIDIIIHSDANQFQLSLTGNDESTVYEFKAQLGAKIVKQNSNQDKERERRSSEACFPFNRKTSESFSVHIVCEDTGFVATVKSSLNRDSTVRNSDAYFNPKHQLPPQAQDVTLLTIVGDVDIIAVCCDTIKNNGEKLAEFLKHPEVISCNYDASRYSSYVTSTNSRDSIFGIDSSSSGSGSGSGIVPSFFQVKSNSVDTDGDGLSSTTTATPESQEPDMSQVLYLLLTSQLNADLESDKEMERGEWENNLMKLLANHPDRMQILECEACGSHGSFDLDKWLVYTRVQCEYPWRANLFPIFPPLFCTIMTHYKIERLSAITMPTFWFACDRLLDSFASVIQTAHQELKYNFCFKTNTELKMNCIEPICGVLKKFIEHFSPVLGQYVVLKVERAVQRRANDTFVQIRGNSTDAVTENETKDAIRIGRELIADLKTGLELWDTCFKKSVGIDCFQVTYEIYDIQYAGLVKTLLHKQMLKPLSHDDTRVLYKVVEQFAGMSHNISQSTTSTKTLEIPENFYTWFKCCIPHWIEGAWATAVPLIRKSVELDLFEPVTRDEKAQFKFSSSAVDAAGIFQQIYLELWNYLSWPSVDDKFSFVIFVLDDLAKCILFYTEVVCERIFRENATRKFDISKEFCFAVSNIEFLVKSTKPFCEKLHVEQILQKMEFKHGTEMADQCGQTIKVVIENVTQLVSKKIGNILNTIGPQMEPVIFDLLQEDFLSAASDKETMAKLTAYLDSNLKRLEHAMSPITQHKTVTIIWKICLIAMRNQIKASTDKGYQPEYFKRIQAMLDIDKVFFGLADHKLMDAVDSRSSGEESSNQDVTKEIGAMLKLHGGSTSEVIGQYLQERYDYQTEAYARIKTAAAAAEIKNDIPDNGMIACQTAYFKNSDTLQVRILNCRRLKLKTNKAGEVVSDSYVKVKLVPYEWFRMPSMKTKVIKKDDHPLFTEFFEISLTPDQMSLGGFISMAVYSKRTRALRDKFLCEAFFPLTQVTLKTDATSTKFEDLPQELLPLTKPAQSNDPFSTGYTLSVTLATLQSRTWDKQAKLFVEKEIRKDRKQQLKGNNDGSTNGLNSNGDRGSMESLASMTSMASMASMASTISTLTIVSKNGTRTRRLKNFFKKKL